MTTIRATCPTCDEVELTPDDIDLRVDPQGARDSYYAFACPTCTGRVRKRADDRIVRLLASGGVAVKDMGVEPSKRYEGPALTYDDLLDFHDLLQSDDWFGELERVVRREQGGV